MKKLFWLSGLILVLAVPAFADAIYHAPSVTGVRERKNTRHLLFIQNLKGDRLEVYEEYGYTPHRTRLNAYGKLQEKWIYYNVGKEFIFDQCGNLEETHNVDVEHRRSWVGEGYGYYTDCND